MNWIDEVEKWTTPVIDVHGHFMVGASNENGGWRPDLIASNADKKNLNSSYQYMLGLYILRKEENK